MSLPQSFSLYTGNYHPEKLRKNNLLAIVSDTDVFCSAMFTKNTCPGAPITVGKEKLSQSQWIRGILVNSNIANVATGTKGIADAKRQCELLAESIGVQSQKILVSSTGCIGPFLPMEKMETAIPHLIHGKKQSLKNASNAIMTTDTKEKFLSIKCGEATISAVAKGSGMIAPNMATMLAYVMTDAKIDSEIFEKIWKQSVEKSFNMVSVDNCESTSDTAIALMNPVHEVEISEFKNAIEHITIFLAKEIAYDGEGATKGIEVRVSGAESEISAKKIALQIVSSNLLKTSIFGKDLNWGRIMGAAGQTHVPIDVSRISCSIGGVTVFKNGSPTQYSKEEEQKVFRRDEIQICFDMHAGNFSATVWGCDLSHEYVTLNAEYRT